MSKNCFLIDHDTRSVINRNTFDKLEGYVWENDLELAVSIISNSDDLESKLSINEMEELHLNLTGKKIKFENDAQASKKCWTILSKIKLTSTKTTTTQKTTKLKTRITQKQLKRQLIDVGDIPIKRKGIKSKLIEIIEDNFDPIRFESLINRFSNETGLGKDKSVSHIIVAVKNGFLKIV